MQQKSIARFVFFLIVSFCAVPCATAGGLYAGSAPVASQSDEDRAVALRAAFSQVIVKLSGNNAVLTRPDVVRAVSKADRYMQSYGYQNDPAQPPGHLQLVVQFDRGSIDGLLHELGLDSAPDSATAAAAPPAPAPGQRLVPRLALRPTPMPSRRRRMPAATASGSRVCAPRRTTRD